MRREDSHLGQDGQEKVDSLVHPELEICSQAEVPPVLVAGGGVYSNVFYSTQGPMAFGRRE